MTNRAYRLVLLAFAVAVIPSSSEAQQVLVRDLHYPFDERLPLTRVSGVALDPAGQLYVGDPVENKIGVYDTRGRILRVMGRSGNGRGEFQRLGPHGLLGDTVWAIDQGLRRVALFDTGGRHLVTFAARAQDPPWPAFPLAALPRGVLRRGLLATVRSGSGPDGQQLVLLGGAGRRLADLGEIDVGKQRLILRTGRAISVTPFQPFNDSRLWALSPSGDRVVVVNRQAARDSRSGRFTISVTTSNGDTALISNCAYTPRPVPERVSSGFVIQALQQHAHMFGSRRDAEAEIRRQLYLPPFYPPVTDVALDGSNRVWLRLEADATAREATWLVVQPGGASFNVSAPARFKVWTASGNLIYGIEQDEDDALYAARYRLTPAAPNRQPSSSSVRCSAVRRQGA